MALKMVSQMPWNNSIIPGKSEDGAGYKEIFMADHKIKNCPSTSKI